MTNKKPIPTLLLLILSIGVCLTLLAGTVAADDWVGGLPLTTVQTGTVTGGLYISGNPPSATYTNVVDRTFTLPTAAVAGSGRIKWARLYVSSYCGHMQDAKAITYATKVDWNNDGTWDNNWTETDSGQSFIFMQGGDYGGGGNDNSKFFGHGTGEPYLMLNEHTNRVTSDYLSWYNVTNLIQVDEPTIKVNVDATGSYDGRIKMVELVVAYDDPSSTTETLYWVNEGHDACTYYTEENEDTVAVGTTMFNTDGISGISSATLIADYMASNNGYYGFPTTDNDFVASTKTGSFTNIGLDRVADTQGLYSGIDSWNVTSSISGSSSAFAYARYLPGTGTAAFYKIPLAFLVVKKPLQSTSAPDAEFTANVTSGTSPLTVQFNDSSTGSPTSWQWDFNNDGTVDSTEQNPIYTYSTAGTYAVNLTVSNAKGNDSEVKTEYITATSAATNDLSISGIVNTVPGSAVFAKEPNTINILNIMNTGTASLSNISVALYASDVSGGTVPVNTTTISSLASGGKATVTLIDPTVRNLEGGTVTYTAVVDPANLITETNEDNNKKSSSAKSVKYNGYKGKGIYWEGGSNITTKHTYDLQGNLLYSTQPDTAYKAVGWTGRTESWTAADLPIPSGSTIEKVFLYFAYNWDQTPGGYPWLNLNFNGNTIENGNLSTGNGILYRDWSNFGGYADYEYGLCVYDVTDKFNEAGNSLVTNPYDSSYNKVALYPSTLVVVYRNSNETRKQIFINEECDELGVSESSYGTTPKEATAYAPFTGMSIDKSSVTNATMYSFAGSAGPDEGNLLFNGNTVATSAWMGSSNSASPLVFDVKDYINETGNEAGIQGTTSGGMDALQQILVVDYQKEQEAAPVANFTANVTSGATPLTVQFTDASTGTVSSYAWDFDNDGAVDSTEQNPVHTYAATGTYTVNLTVSNADGSDSEVKTEYIKVTGLSPGKPVAAFSASPASGKTPLTVAFTDTSTGTPTKWKWSFGDGTSSSIQNPKHKYSAAGKYTVTLTVTNAKGSNTVTETDYIKVIAKPVANFTSSVTSGKAPLNIKFTDASTGTPSSWIWEFGDGSKSFVENPTHKYSKAGTYTVNLTVKNAAGRNTVTKTEHIKVIEKPVANFTSSVTSGKVPLTVAFTDIGTGSPTKWKWSFGDGTTSTQQSPKHKYSKAGSYTVTLTATNAAGSSTATKTDCIKVTTNTK
jgi:PKD repeat protein